ncbi:MAG: NADH-quinone oxidoreductase subunit A [Deltaproteobacteria bacterium]|nr:NADH-quinone oxidoreductase subunit A [Deltaproteobacteria bacterium]
MLRDYLPIAVLFALGVLIGGAFLGLSACIGRKRPTAEKLAPYECGLDPVSSPRQRFSVKFFLVAMVFLLFDVEVTFLFPWAVLVRRFTESGLGTFIFVEGLLFIFVLAIGLVYVWRRGALEWEK